MTRILYIGSGTPWTGGAGYLVRQAFFLHALIKVADLHLVMFDAPLGAPMPPFPCGLTFLPSPQRKNSSKLAMLYDDIFSADPRMIRGYDRDAPRQAVAALHPEEFDAVFAFRTDFAYFAGVLDHPRLILDIDDVEHIRWQRRLRATLGHDGDWRTRRDLLKLRRFEFDAVFNAKLSLVCQENDSDGWPAVPRVVPNTVEVLPEPSRRVSSPRLMFVGNCAGGAASANVDAVLYFLSKIWPRILYDMPSAELQVIGATNPAVQRAAAESSRVQLAGFLPDLVDAYAQAAISIAPIRFGTGTRIKILEAFAHACPVVSTVLGAEGIAAIPGRDIELAYDDIEFSSHCVRLLEDTQSRERIGQGGHALARRLYDRASQHARVIQLLEDFLQMHVPGASSFIQGAIT